MAAITHRFAEFALQTAWSDLPASVRTESTRAFTNWVGCAVGGSTTPTAAAALRGLQALGRHPGASVLGRSERLDFVDAATLDCISSSAHTFDDTHLKTITHPTGPVAAALLAYSQTTQTAQTARMSGIELLGALAVGMEIECRVATAIAAPASGAHKGWYMTGLAGGIGAAAALARAMRLDHAQAVAAMGLAAVHAGGLRASHGSMAIACVPAAAARQALYAAHLARGGFSCSDIAIDGRNGLLNVIAPAAGTSGLDAGLGSTFELMNNAYKPYPCGIVIHPAIDACLEVAAAAGFRWRDVERIELEVHPDALALCWRRLPASELDAQVSLYHWVAAALVRGAAGIDEGSLACVMDPSIRALQERIVANASSSLDSDQATLVARTIDGRRFRADVQHATGSIARPMSDAQLDAKFVGLARRALSADRVGALLAACRGLEDLEDAAQVARKGAAA
jgi:2-methylcitrate dehydratase PrpD